MFQHWIRTKGQCYLFLSFVNEVSINVGIRIVYFHWHLITYPQVQNEQLNAKVIQLEKQLESIPKLELENQQLKEKLDVNKHMEDEFLNMVGVLNLHINVVEKERSLRDSEDCNQSLIIKEREINDELQKDRKKLIEVRIFFYKYLRFS